MMQAPRAQGILRLVSFALAALLGLGLSLIVAAAQDGGEQGAYRWLPWLFVALIGLGSLLYMVGNALWVGRSAQLLRVAGLALMTLALVIPTWSTTLALPLLIPLFFTLRHIPAGGDA